MIRRITIGFSKIIFLHIILVLIQANLTIAQSTDNKDNKDFTVIKFKIIVNENYGNVEPSNPAGKQALNDVKDLLESHGFTTVENPDQQPDAIIEISFRGTPRSAMYSSAGKCYTGAFIGGNIILNYNENSISKKFSGNKPVATAVNANCNRHPERAPFVWAMKNSDLSAVLSNLISSTFNIDEIKSLILSLNSEWVSPQTTNKIVKKGKSIVPYLTELLENPTSKDGAKASAALILGEIGTKDYDAINALSALLKIDGKPKSYNRQAAYALGLIGDSKSVNPLIKALEYEKSWCFYQVTVINALGEIGDAQAIIPLKEALEDPNRKCGLKNIPVALGRIGGLEAIEIIIDSLDHDRWDVRKSADTTLRKITGKKFVSGKDIEKDQWKKLWLDDKSVFLNKSK